ncbi:MAG: ATP-dependent RecD-like DNA helicase [Pseudomonadota bacterium]|nr:ATP-dependent RecD-like DNA helicase [Pseudomonadota bacterium]
MISTLNFDKNKLEKLSATVTKITFHNKENGFIVMKVKFQRKEITVVGSVMQISVSEEIDCEGKWIKDKAYGIQFRAETIVVKPPTTLAGIEKYLSSGMVKGIGPNLAKNLIAKFGSEVLDIIENKPHRLLELEGFGKKRQEQILVAWQEQKVIRNIMIFLQSHGIGSNRAVRIYKTYGNNSIDIIRRNPYKLSYDIHGIGFKIADKLALSIGIPSDSLIRAQAGLTHCLHQLAEQGNTAAIKNELIAKTVSLLAAPTRVVEKALDIEIDASNIKLLKQGDNYLCASNYLYQAELSVAKHIRRIKSHTTHNSTKLSPSLLEKIQKENNIQLAPSQIDATNMALSHSMCIITGGPGVGKTTLVNIILAVLRRSLSKILLAAPTGRAAKRLTQTTKLEAKTIHRLLGFSPEKSGFKHDNDNPLLADLLVVDECSMIDIVLMSKLLQAIPNGCKLILVGDVDQLPSVGPGSMLANCIESNVITSIKLTEIFRQAKSSKIVTNAHLINSGKMPIYKDADASSDFFFIHNDNPQVISEKLLNIVKTRIPEKFKLNPKSEIQVLTPTNRGELGVINLNNILQKALNPNPITTINHFNSSLSTGDKVIQLINNYEKEVFNGDSGFIQSIDTSENKLKIDFSGNIITYEFSELDEISLAWATTIHKSQGSEYPAVVIPITTQHFSLLQRNLIYTAITRGKKLVVVLGQTKALAMAIKNESAKSRQTFLKHLLTKNTSLT